MINTNIIQRRSRSSEHHSTGESAEDGPSPDTKYAARTAAPEFKAPCHVCTSDRPLSRVAEKRAVAPYTQALCLNVECKTSASSTKRFELGLLALALAEYSTGCCASDEGKCSDLSRRSTAADSSGATFGLAALLVVSSGSLVRLGVQEEEGICRAAAGIARGIHRCPQRDQLCIQSRYLSARRISSFSTTKL